MLDPTDSEANLVMDLVRAKCKVLPHNRHWQSVYYEKPSSGQLAQISS
jgi:hypothetical protein